MLSMGLDAIEGKSGNGLGKGCLRHGENSGHQAINLAYLLGASHIYLLGYDMGATGKTHWFGSHPKELHQGEYSSYVSNFNQIARDLKAEGVRVVNFTRQTALNQFERADIDDWDFHSHKRAISADRLADAV